MVAFFGIFPKVGEVVFMFTKLYKEQILSQNSQKIHPSFCYVKIYQLFSACVFWNIIVNLPIFAEAFWNLKYCFVRIAFQEFHWCFVKASQKWLGSFRKFFRNFGIFFLNLSDSFPEVFKEISKVFLKFFRSSLKFFKN